MHSSLETARDREQSSAASPSVITDPTCTIYLNTNGTTPAAYSWAELVAANPTWTIVSDQTVPFIMADTTGTWTISNVKLGKTARTTGK